MTDNDKTEKILTMVDFSKNRAKTVWEKITSRLPINHDIVSPSDLNGIAGGLSDIIKQSGEHEGFTKK